MPGFESATNAARSLGNTYSEMADQVEGAAQRVSESVSQINEGLASSNQALTDSVPKILQKIDELDLKSINQLDDLKSRMENLESGFKEEILRMISRVEDGSKTLDDFLSLFGRTKVVAEEGFVRIEELLAGMDPTVFAQQGQAIRRAIEQEVLGIEEIVSRLREQTNIYAQGLADLFAKFEEGGITLDELRRNIEIAQQALGPNSITGNLAQGALLAAIEIEQRRGG